MRDEMSHRGPDSAGMYVNEAEKVGLGFRRLAIIDLSERGNQPMSNADNTLHIVFNGEIYNHEVLRKELEKLGFKYRSRSDTETILHGYEAWGKEVVHRLLGMFSIAIYDSRRNELFVARDRIGVKPLYYTFADGVFLFASEVKSLLKYPGVRREMDDEEFYHYLTYLVAPAPKTLFKNIFKLEAGTWGVIDSSGNFKTNKFWSLLTQNGEQPTIDIHGNPVNRSGFIDEFESLNPANREEFAVGSVKELLTRSISDRMMSDVPFGVFLSGGVDSSTNVALMANMMQRPVDTFSVGFRDLEKYNELGYARAIAEKFRTNHHEIIIDSKTVLPFLSELPYYQDEPIADPVCVPLYFVSRLARENGTIVVQIGEGSDELFAGYSWMLREIRFHDTLWKFYTSFPKLMRKAAYAPLSAFLRRTRRYLELEYLRKGTYDENLFWGGAINFTEDHKKELIGPHLHLNGLSSSAVPDRFYREIDESGQKLDFLQKITYIELANRLPELLLMRVDKMTMAASIEGRDPFLDHRLAEFAFRLPQSLRIKNGVSKYILKKAVEGLIPNEIIYRRKQGFAAPITEWMRGELHGWLASELMSSRLVSEGFLDKTHVQSLMTIHKSGKRDFGQLLWNLLNVSLWYKRWIG
jgi:asparagine synthase (glutamine-hydrolysing)